MSATIIEKENNNKISEKRKIFNIIYKIKDKKKNKRLRGPYKKFTEQQK